jgi:hypothetical protein
MTAVSDFANLAAAQAAGYVAIQTDRGAQVSYDRFVTVLEKYATGVQEAGATSTADRLGHSSTPLTLLSSLCLQASVESGLAISYLATRSRAYPRRSKGRCRWSGR